MIRHKYWLLIALMCMCTLVNAETRVNVVGLFSDRALVSINGGAPQAMRAGQTVNGVKLIAANSEAATLIVEGKRQVLKMGQAMSVAGSAAPVTEEAGINAPVNLYADSRGHFYGDMQINGVSLKYVVDTGASTVALNSADAKYAKIDYEKGEKVPVSTANGIATAYLVRLNTLKIGTIVLHDVVATVSEGGFPTEVLLGMTVLNRLEMKRDSGVMTLKKKY